MSNKVRNSYLDLGKFVLACLVIFIHFVLSDKLGSVVDCFARLAVPFFFLISGYYSYNCDLIVLKRRLWRNTGLLVVSTFIYFVWGVWQAFRVTEAGFVNYISGKITLLSIRQFLLFGVNPFMNHLWFLYALVNCYLFLILSVVVFRTKKVLYAFLGSSMVVLILLHFYLGTFMPIIQDVVIDHYYFRNGWLFGIPMFLVGLFINKWNQKRAIGVSLVRTVSGFVFVLGVLLAEWQWSQYGKIDMPIGIFFASIALFMLLNDLPGSTNNGFNKIAIFLGQTSLWIYVVHKLVGEWIRVYSTKYGFLTWVVSNDNRFPVVVMILSVLLSFIITVLLSTFKKRKPKKT